MTGRRASSSPRYVGRHRTNYRRPATPDTALAWAMLTLALVIFWSMVVWVVILL